MQHHAAATEDFGSWGMGQVDERGDFGHEKEDI